MAWKPFDQTPSEFIVASMLSLPNFCMSSKFLTMGECLSGPIGRVCQRRGPPEAPPASSRPVRCHILHCTKMSRGCSHCSTECAPEHLDTEFLIKYVHHARITRADHLTLWQSPWPSLV